MKHLTVAVHDGAFHADDVCAIAILKIAFRHLEVVRTRHKALIEKADVVVDVGNQYQPERGRFDHHQKGGAGCRPDGIPYAAAGLVWKELGEDAITALIADCDPEEAATIWTRIDKTIISLIDAVDNGNDERGASALSTIVASLNPHWPFDNIEEIDRAFEIALALCEAVLSTAIRTELGSIRAVRLLDSVASREGAILVLSESIPYRAAVENDESIHFVVMPHRDGKQGICMTVPSAGGPFIPRKRLPEPWAGLRDQELARVCGVRDAVFCHDQRFVAFAGSVEGALAMARFASRS